MYICPYIYIHIYIYIGTGPLTRPRGGVLSPCGRAERRRAPSSTREREGPGVSGGAGGWALSLDIKAVNWVILFAIRQSPGPNAVTWQ